MAIDWNGDGPRDRLGFQDTRWRSVIWRAARGSPEGLRALCIIYEPPIRRLFLVWSRSAEDADELTQRFFERLLKNGVGTADPDLGRFRDWLKTAARHHWISELRRRSREGGGIPHVSLDAARAEGREDLEPGHGLTPAAICEAKFERDCAITLLDQVLEELRGEYQKRANVRLFERLKPCLTHTNDRSHAKIAEELGEGMNEVNFNVALHRCKKRFIKLLKQKVALTVSTDAEVEEELRYLLDVLRSR